MIPDVRTPGAVTHLPRRSTDTPDVAELVREHVASLSLYSEMRYEAAAPETKDCTWGPCTAKRGEPCRTSSGWIMAGFHGARTKAVAGLSKAEKIEAYATLVVEKELAQREVKARMAEREADPTYVAKRDATRAYFNTELARIDDTLRAEARDLSARCTDHPAYGQFRTHSDGCQCRIVGDVEWTNAVLETRRREAMQGQLPVTDLSEVRAQRRVTRVFPSGGAA